MKQKFFTLLALFACVLTASADNSVTVKSVEMAPGAQAKVNLELTNDVAFKGYSFSLTLPTGVSAVTETRALPTETSDTPSDQEVVKVAFTDRQAADNFYVFSNVNGQKVDLLVLPKPEAAQAIAAGTGLIMSVFVTVPAETVVAGTPCDEATGAIGDIVFTDGNQDTDMAGNDALKFQTYRLGDTTKTGAVDIDDYLNVASFILYPSSPTDFQKAVADVTPAGNPDGVIDVDDYMGVASIILYGNVSGSSSAPKLIKNEIEPE